MTDKDTDLSGRARAVACYGLYNEFDPKTKLTNYRDQRCVISIDVSGYPDSQKGKGMYRGKCLFPPTPRDRSREILSSTGTKISGTRTSAAAFHS